MKRAREIKLMEPKALSDISLDQVQRVLLIDKLDDMEPWIKKVHSVAIMFNETPKHIGIITPSDLDVIYSRMFAMINGVGSSPLTRYLKYLGREYAFIEDIRDMETGAFVDIDQMCQGDHYADNLHKIMAILYRPIDAKLGGKYRLKSYVREDSREREERQAIFLKHMTLAEVRGAAGFFLLTTQKCLNILDGSFPQVPSLTLESVIRGAGITSFTQLVEEAL
jgi:hypothetical protein